MKRIEEKAVRDAIVKAITIAGLSPKHAFLTFAGILPLNLPDGTRIVVLPDIHAPAHNKRLMWAVKKFLAKYKPHILISIGDLADIFALSRHPKGLRVPTNAQKEFEDTRRLWDELVEISGCVWSFIILGNHEDRVYRFLQDMAPQLGGVVDPHTREPFSFHAQLGYTKDDNITFIYGTEERGGYEGGLLINNDLSMHHGILVRPKPGQSAIGDMDRWMWNIIHGHTHRMGMAARELSTPSEEYLTGVLRAFELGHLVDPNHSYMSYAKQMFPNWHPGFGVFNVHNGVVHMQPVPIKPVDVSGGREKLGFVYDGELFVESDR
jgi:predicted MPP superfamily phosphohydrolase